MQERMKSCPQNYTEKRMASLRISVKMEHIRKGCPNKYYQCPVALAARDAVKQKYGKETKRIQVSQLDAIFIDGFRCELPDPVQIWIKKFDKGMPVNPIEFDIEGMPDGFV
jgi:hypothetical protein